MNRREFIRTAIATTAMLAVGVTGMFEIAERAANQPAAPKGIQLPPISAETSQSATSEVSALASSSASSAQSAPSQTEVSSADSQASSSAQASTSSQESSTSSTNSSLETSSETTSDTTSATTQSSSTSSSTSSQSSSSTSSSSSSTSSTSSTSTSSSQSSTASTSTSTSTTETSTSTETSSSTSGPTGYVLVAQLSALQGETYAYFTHPTAGPCILVYYDGQWNAFSSICTHRPCTVEYESSEIYCPCHGATFSASNGDVTKGPARVQLAQYGVLIQDDEVWVSDSPVN